MAQTGETRWRPQGGLDVMEANNKKEVHSKSNAICIENLTKRFGNTLANDDINLRIEAGELMTLLGPSGCGKTTFLRCISGSLQSDAGRILINGEDVTSTPMHQRNMGMVFQTFALFPHMTVLQNIEFPLKLRHVPRSVRRNRAKETIRMVQLEGLEKRYPRHISGGQQQRVGLARAIVYEPRILLMDEPLSNLDAKLREQMRFEIRDLQIQLGITTIYVTHDQDEALALSDRITVMEKGSLHQVGSPREVYDSPTTEFVAGFVGLANFLPGVRIACDDREGSCIRIETGHEIVVSRDMSPTPQRDVTLMIRPAEIQLMSAAGRTMSGANVFSAIVTKSSYLGNKFDYQIDIGPGFSLRVQTSGVLDVGVGETVNVQLPPERCMIIPRS